MHIRSFIYSLIRIFTRNREDTCTRFEKYSSKLDISRSFIRIFVAMTENEKLALQERIIEALKTVYDPEIPVNIYDLGLIYRIELTDDARAEVDMTLTAPNCPAADFIMEDVRMRVEGITGITSATINLVFEPEWDKDMMSEEAKLELGFL